MGNKGFYILLASVIAIAGASAYVNKTRESIAQLNSQEVYDLGGGDSPLITFAPTMNPTPYENQAQNREPIPTEEAFEVFNEADDIIFDYSFIMPAQGEILCGFSGDELVYDKTMKDWRTHSGIDIAVDEVGFVCAAGDGTVMKSYDDELYGYTMEIDHGNGISSIYRGLDKTTVLQVGEEVRTGDLIARAGENGIAEAHLPRHIHFAIKKDGKYVSPEDYIN